MPAPATVTEWRWSSGTDVAGTNASTITPRQPVSRPVYSQAIPPMWVNGKTSAVRSPASMASASSMPTADALTVWSVWRAPFGSAVVPEV